MNPSKFLTLFLGLVLSCTAPTDQKGTFVPEGMNRRDKMRYQQYLLQGKKLYLTHCSNCHQNEGQGLVALYPPLAKSDYLMENIPRAACIIRNGLQGEIEVNGVGFNMKMEGHPELKPLEIAEILTYISNSWGNEYGFVQVLDVQQHLRNCENY